MKTSSTATNNRFSLARATSKTKFLTPLHRRIGRYAGSLISLLFLGSTYAQPLDIAISDAQFTTFVSAAGISNGIQTMPSRTMVSSSPTSDDLIEYSDMGGIYYSEATASASLFEVGVYTYSFVAGGSRTSATSQLWFSPLVDQTQTIDIQFSLEDHYSFTSGSVSLFDLTSNLELWNYYWNGFNDDIGNVPWAGGQYGATTIVNQETDYLASDQYELITETSSNAGSDQELAQIQLTGLQVVPEPSSICLLLMALLGLPVARRIAIR